MAGNRGVNEKAELNLGDNSVVFAMVTDPEPDKIGRTLDCDGAIMNSHAHRPEIATFLK